MKQNANAIPERYYILPTDDNFFVTYGTTNQHTTEIVYLKCNTKITNNDESSVDFSEIAENLRSDLNAYIAKILPTIPYYHKNYICNIEISNTTTKYHKNRYIKYELFLRLCKPSTMAKHEKKAIKLAQRINKRICRLVKKYDLRFLE